MTCGHGAVYKDDDRHYCFYCNIEMIPTPGRQTRIDNEKKREGDWLACKDCKKYPCEVWHTPDMEGCINFVKKVID